MASVINSARRSTASVFDFVGNTAEAVNSLVSTGTRAIDALDRKTQVMHARVKANAAAQLVNVTDDEIMKAALEHVDLLEETHRRIYPDDEFNRKDVFTASLAKIKAAVEAA